MIQVKIYDKNHNPLTTFNVGEYSSLSYRKTLGQIGEASFTLELTNQKVTEANTRNYNRIEITHDDHFEWSGYIIKKRVTFNTVTIQCKETIGILAKRLTVDHSVNNGNPITLLGNLITAMNIIDNTGITLGDTDAFANINMTFNQQDMFSVVQAIAEVCQAQFKVDNAGKLIFKTSIGVDRSSEVSFKYNVLQPQLATILNFDVEDDGDNLVSRSWGKNDPVISQQDDATLITKYGVIEKFTTFSEANNASMLDKQTQSILSDTLYTPTIVITPYQEDDFDIGDTVNINIQNKLISINGNFQILDKSVKIVNSEKQISIKINKLPKDITDSIKSLQRSINLIETK